MSKVKADSRASTQPHVTLEEITTLRNHWMNIAHDFDLLHELYGEGDPRVVLVFGTSKLPSLEQMQKFAEEVRRLFETNACGDYEIIFGLPSSDLGTFSKSSFLMIIRRMMFWPPRALEQELLVQIHIN
jgi:hypothetical protein